MIRVIAPYVVSKLGDDSCYCTLRGIEVGNDP